MNSKFIALMVVAMANNVISSEKGKSIDEVDRLREKMRIFTKFASDAKKRAKRVSTSSQAKKIYHSNVQICETVISRCRRQIEELLAK